MNEMTKNLNLTPQAIEAEQSILGSMMLDNRFIEDAESIVSALDFYRHDHAVIFEAITKVFNSTGAADLITVAESLALSGHGDDIGVSYLGQITKSTPNAGSVLRYAEIVKDKAMLRQLIDHSTESIQRAYSPEGEDAIDVVSDAANRIGQIENDSKTTEAETISSLIPKFVDSLQSRFDATNSIIGYSTGFKGLDQRWSGLECGKVYVIAGRPKMGKSTLMINLAVNIARQGLMSHIFTLEMPEMQVVNKMVSNLGNVDYSKIRNPKTIVEQDSWTRITAGGAIAKKLNIVIDDQARLSISQIRTSARGSIKKYGKGVIFIDYLQLMRVDDSKNLVEAIGDITSRLKEMAKSFDVPIVLLSQLNRSVDTRPNKRPIPSDLRSSGSIEQDADAVAFVYREEVYEPDTDQKGIAEIITSAIRDGEAGTDRVIFNGDKQRFEDFKEIYTNGAN
ncbi:MAG: replicative DNA helicase [Arenicella sp.]|jgi:replicative DNA helicase